MIEIFRKGFRFDISPTQIVTFKKAQNLNGIQGSYSYSNTVPMEKTANNKKLLDLFDLPTNKVSSLMNGYEVDIILNGSIQLRNQTLKIQKEGRDKIDTYILYSDNALVVKLKEQFLVNLAAPFTYKKTVTDFFTKQGGLTSRSAFTETQEKSGFYVIEEMPILIQVQELIRKVFTDNHYRVYGDFFTADNAVSEYYITSNMGVYQIYGESGDGFAPTFTTDLDLYTFLIDTLKYFNSYVMVDDTYKTVTINSWTNLGNYKNDFVNYSRFFIDYQDYTFQSQLAKRNDLIYADSGTTFNSFFSNTLSSQDKVTYLASAFGAGTLNIFNDSELDPATNMIALRADGSTGESSAIRIMKVAIYPIVATVYVGGVPQLVPGQRAVPVSMREVYTSFHKDYTDFILTPVIQNLVFRYDDILAATFSMTKVFFIEQQSSYWIPLEINFSTKKDSIIIKAMLIKKRKVPSPILNNFNSIFLDFKEKGIFPLSYLLGMYPMPPNQYPIEEVIFKSYDAAKNRLYVNDIFVPANSLPQAYSQSDLVSIKIEANAPGDITPDKNSSSIYIQVVDTNGGVSNEAYINVVHTGIAKLESNFAQLAEFTYSRSGFDDGALFVSLGDYYVGDRPNLNSTLEATLSSNGIEPDDTFNLIVASENYVNVKIEVPSFNLHMKTDNNSGGNARAICRLMTTGDGLPARVMSEASVSNNDGDDFILGGTYTIPNFNISNKVRVYLDFDFENTRTGNIGSMDVELTVNNFAVNISTTKTI